jgi:hypothetical protein
VLPRHSGRAKREPESITPAVHDRETGVMDSGSRLRRAPE